MATRRAADPAGTAIWCPVRDAGAPRPSPGSRRLPLRQVVSRLPGPPLGLDLEERGARPCPVPTRVPSSSPTPRDRAPARRGPPRPSSRAPRNVVQAPPTRTSRCSSIAGRRPAQLAARPGRSCGRRSRSPTWGAGPAARRRASTTSRSLPVVDQPFPQLGRRLLVADRQLARGRRRHRRRAPPPPASGRRRCASSPARIARSTGAAPRQRGRSEKWRFTMGSCSSTGRRMI